MDINLKKEIIETLKKTLSDEQIATLVNQQLEAYAALQLRLPDPLLFDDFMHYSNCRKKAIENYPSVAVNAIVETLNELPQDKDWVKISNITAKLNTKLQALNIESYSGKKVSNLLKALGFYKRIGKAYYKSAFIDRNLLREYGDTQKIPSSTEATTEVLKCYR